MKRLLLALACASIAMGATVTLTMDEVSLQPIDGLAVSKGGITFTFSDPDGNLNYNSPGLGMLTYVQDPTIAGTPEPFGVAFSVPVYSIQFGFAGDPSSITPMATVKLYNGATLIATTPLNYSVTHSSPLPVEEGQFIYSSATPVTSITVTPSNSFAVIAFDNLTVTSTPPPTQPTVPATSSWTLALMTLGIVGVGGYALRRPFRITTSH
jgi:hypothetical protein